MIQHMPHPILYVYLSLQHSHDLHTETAAVQECELLNASMNVREEANGDFNGLH